MNYNNEQLNSKLNEDYDDYTISEVNNSIKEKTLDDGFLARYHWNSDLMKKHQVNYHVRIKKSTEACGKINEKLLYADLKIRFEPQKEAEELLFENALTNSLFRIPEKYIAVTERSLREMMKKGALGFPLVGLKATIYDGSYHPVISNEYAFKKAAEQAFLKGMSDACPVIVEPIGSLRIFLNKHVHLNTINEITNDIRSNMRGLHVKVEDSITKFVIKASVPFSEMDKFDSKLHSLTGELGRYTFEFTGYNEAPFEVQEAILELKKKEHFFDIYATDNLTAEFFYGGKIE